MKRILSLMLVLVMILALGACAKNNAEPAGSEPAEAAAAGETLAGKNMSEEDAKYQIEVAMQYLLEETYGEKVNDARISVEKVYSADDEAENEALATYELGADDYAFEVKYELHPADGVDPNEFLAGTGEFDEETGWIINKTNVGILRPNEAGEPAYVIDSFGTGF